MGIIPLFNLVGAKLTPLFYGKITLINKARSIIKVFETYVDSSKESSIVNAILISYGCVFVRSSKAVLKGYEVESIEEARKRI